jgi:hypothetical protein
MEILRRCLRTRDINHALQNLPRSLDSTYERMLGYIDEIRYQEAYAIFNWLIASKRSLTLRELAGAAVVQLTAVAFNPEDRLDNLRDVLRICGCLTTNSTTEKPVSSAHMDETGVVRFAHFSVQEYLLSERAKRFNVSLISSENHVMGSCLQYLQYLETLDDPTLKECPLFAYAARNWSEHCHDRETMEQSNTRLIDRLLEMTFLFMHRSG